MPAVTALILAAFAAYAGAWYLGAIEGDFALLLFMATVVTGAYWLADKLYFRPRRRLADAQQTGVSQSTSASAEGERTDGQPWWLDWTAGLFPVILLVFLLRSFVFEPFKIPSGSMIPTLRIGDLILVNKFVYGVKLPVINKRMSQGRDPERGEVIVFRYPPQPNIDYIKRVIGLPGDEVAYLDKQLSINGQPVAQTPEADFFDDSSLSYFKQYGLDLNGREHHIIINERLPTLIGQGGNFAYKDHCQYNAQGVRCTVPEGHYFVMGDNRDNSLDSRYWGFVPEENIVGKAFFVWMNFGNLKQIGVIH